MNPTAIQVEHLGKRYHIGEHPAAYGTLRDTLAHTLRRSLRLLGARGGHRVPAEIWALRDVSFCVRPGEVLGIIGRNGAGKSTLLKVLSRVTRPTVGRAWIHGRVGSLLEVGTGFHPELSGRENIYLNGAVLGMPKAEIDRKFDEIVAFAETEPFLDTPVKRYSSGMYMRLAFAVAAHLEPDILIVDEVLAVGDAAFQKKCLGKIGNVAREGRTVLFVSHNMQAILALCHRALWLHAGELVEQGATATIVQHYLESAILAGAIPLDQRRDRSGDGSARITSLHVESADGEPLIHSSSRLKFTISYCCEQVVRHPQFVISIADGMNIGLYVLHNEFVGGLPEVLPPMGKVCCETAPINLTPGHCLIHLELLRGNVQADLIECAGAFDVEAEDVYGSGMMPPREWALGVLHHKWWLDGD